MKLEFPTKKFVGIDKLIPNVSEECREIILKMLIYNADNRYTASQLLRHPFFADQREYEMEKFPQGSQGFARSISRSNLAENLSQYSRRNSDNASDPGGSTTNAGINHNNSVNAAHIAMNNSISGAGYSGSVGQHSFYNPVPNKKKLMGVSNVVAGKKQEKKKALPITKKFPELKLMINGE